MSCEKGETAEDAFRRGGSLGEWNKIHPTVAACGELSNPRCIRAFVEVAVRAAASIVFLGEGIWTVI